MQYKRKHRLSAALMAGAMCCTMIPAVSAGEIIAPETAQTATLDPDAAVLYTDLPDAPTGSYIGSEGLPVATGQTKISLSLWADGQLEQDSHLDPDALNSGDKTVTVPLTEDTDYAIVPLMAQVEYPADGSRTDVLLPENVTLLDYYGEPAQDTTVLHSEYAETSAAATGLYLLTDGDFTAQLVYTAPDGNSLTQNLNVVIDRSSTAAPPFADRGVAPYAGRPTPAVTSGRITKVAKVNATWLIWFNGEPAYCCTHGANGQPNGCPPYSYSHTSTVGADQCIPGDHYGNQIRIWGGLNQLSLDEYGDFPAVFCAEDEAERSVSDFCEMIYGRIIGYRKGADGKPEIIPEQAEIIRLIFNSYLQGDSLQSIKAKLETAGALTARGNTAWSAQSIQRILQNEKYCGDVLLQKTFTEDVLTGVHKKNTGQLPQYYIENYHEGIVSKQMFREVQAEIARRNSKSAANQRKRRRGRYNSKYALSERLFCGDCGSPYKRVTWNIHGRKQIVWRCVNRIEYGTKFCGNSPSIPEEELHRAILKAIQGLAANFTDEVAAQINGILHNIQTGESTKPNLQEQLEQTQQEFDRLLEMSLDFDEDTPFLDNRLKKLNNKIKSLKKAIEDTAAQQEKASQPEMLLSAKDLQIQEYDDALTARIIEKITVRSRNEIEIRFIGGYKKTMRLA